METAEEKINSRKRGRDQQNNDVTKRARIMPEGILFLYKIK